MQVILYSTGCPRCKTLKAALKSKEINYTECNDTNKMIELGFTTVPVLQIDDMVLQYKEAMKYVMEEM